MTPTDLQTIHTTKNGCSYTLLNLWKNPKTTPLLLLADGNACGFPIDSFNSSLLHDTM